MGILNVFKKGKKDKKQEELNALESSLMDDLGDGIVGEVEHGGPREEEKPDDVVHCSLLWAFLVSSLLRGRIILS